MRVMNYRKKPASQGGFIIMVTMTVFTLLILSCNLPAVVDTPEYTSTIPEPQATDATETLTYTSAVATREPSEVPTETPVVPTHEPSNTATQTPVPPTPTETMLPTNTPSVTSTETTQIQVESFSETSWLTVPPEDILEQLAYGGVGGGGDIDYDICSEILPLPAVTNQYLEEIELFRSTVIRVCGLTPNETVRVLRHQPDGEIKREEFEADSSGGLEYQFGTTLGDPVGEYILEFRSSSGSTEANSQVLEPDGPRLVELEEDALLLLYNFSREENVRLLVYTDRERKMRKLFAWQELQVDRKGQLLVELDLPPAQEETSIFGYYTYFAIGEHSNTIGKELIYFSCPGAMRSRLSFEMPTRVTFTDGTPLRVRTQPGFSGTILRLLPEGHELYITGGPRCLDKVVWWPIYVEGQDGWVAEGEDDVYYIEPWFER